jgi:hypothetical protein
MYYPQYDPLEKLSKGKNWKFVEVRPDEGFTVSAYMEKCRGDCRLGKELYLE